MRPVVLLPDIAFIYATHAVIVVGIHRTVKTIYALFADLMTGIRRKHPVTDRSDGATRDRI
jgi:hypothetical protein